MLTCFTSACAEATPAIACSTRALAASNFYVLNATRRGVKIHDLEIALEGNFENILKWAGHSQSGNPGYPSIKAKCFVRADADEKTLREIWQAAVDGSPVTQTVARPTQIITEFEKV